MHHFFRAFNYPYIFSQRLIVKKINKDSCAETIITIISTFLIIVTDNCHKITMILAITC